MQLLEREVKDVLVVAPSGVIQWEEALAFQRAVLARIDEGAGKVLVDLSGTEMLASSGISALINVYKRLNTGGGRFALCGLHGVVKSALETSRLEELFEIYPDEHTAMQALAPKDTHGAD